MLKFNINQVKLYQPPPNSHKGQNGKLLVIGGSKLFHSGIFWSADAASKIVDLVHLTSPANENNQIFRKRLKEKFWNGIVVDWGDVESYIEEDDVVLIGPGMVRSEKETIEDREMEDSGGEPDDGRWKIEDSGRRLKMEDRKIGADRSIFNPLSSTTTFHHPPSIVSAKHHPSSSELDRWGKEDKTDKIVNFLLKKYPNKRWVIDGGALQEMDVKLITKSCILTPHRGEFEKIMSKWEDRSVKLDYEVGSGKLSELSNKLDDCTILLKSQTDIVCQGKRCVEIKGGNPGMTKGGTGDVLAGLVAALYCKNDAWTAATVSSFVNKKAGDELFKKVGVYFNAADLVEKVPKILREIGR